MRSIMTIHTPSLVRIAVLAAGLLVGSLGDGSAQTTALPAGVTTRDVEFFSEQVKVRGRLFLPRDFAPGGQTPAVVLAPGQGRTAESVEHVAARLAAEGIVALAFDYRGWGRSGAFLYVDNQEVRTDDRLRFSQHTAQVTFRRRRISPEAQLYDLRNAITFVQGQPGIARDRIGVWGTDLGGGHAVALAGIDPRVNVVVAEVPVIAGAGEEPLAFVPSPQIQADMIRLARTPPHQVTTAAAAGTADDPDTRVALARYRPFHYLPQIPETVAIRFIVAGRDRVVDNAQNATAASRTLRGPTDVVTIADADHDLAGDAARRAADAAADWFRQRL
jgi:uncharacterized protein